MTTIQVGCILLLLIASVLFTLIPAAIAAALWFRRKFTHQVYYRRSVIRFFLAAAGCILMAIFCQRFAVGYYAILSAGPEENSLTVWEELFRSLTVTFQAFSIDVDYVDCMLKEKKMMEVLFGSLPLFGSFFAIYFSSLYTIAPVVGGAVLLEILTSVSPRIRLAFSYLMFWKEKYYFSELNEASMALVRSLCKIHYSFEGKPVMIFTDAYVDSSEEMRMELMLEAKQLGAICVRDDLAHIRKSFRGDKKYFLMDEREIGNLHTLTGLANANNQRCLRNAEIYFFTNSDAYTQIEYNMQGMLRKKGKDAAERDLTVFIPVVCYRNLILNLLVKKLPLFEPLIGKPRDSEGMQTLTVSILGSGSIGTEMFLSVYWMGQLLDCRLQINVLSQESEEEFWSKIDYVNPEIRHTTLDGDPILQINQKGDMAPVYCKVNYISCDVKSSRFIASLQSSSEEHILETDYYFVALGSDDENVSVANTIRKYVGQYHIHERNGRKAVIAYVVYDPDLSDTLNFQQRFTYVGEKPDIIMCAVGNLDELYSVANVFMSDYKEDADQIAKNYSNRKERKQMGEKRREKHKNRAADEYKYWADMARGMHIPYKMYSMGFLRKSRFDFADGIDEEYKKYYEKSKEAYREYLRTGGYADSEEEKEEFSKKRNKMAWLEHRRWNAFTRVKGFRCTADYRTYGKPGEKGSYKQMDIKLHPCLVECDQQGVRKNLFSFSSMDREQMDLLDELSFNLFAEKYNGYDFKVYDYPEEDFPKEV